MSLDVNIRTAVREDAECISETLVASIERLCAADHQDDPMTIAAWTANKTVENIAQWFDNPNATFLLAEIDNRSAGVGAYSLDGEIILNYVHPTFRFNGVSSTLLTHMENVLRGVGVREGSLVSTQTAHRFYRDAGWIDSGDADTFLGMDGFPMKKELIPAL